MPIELSINIDVDDLDKGIEFCSSAFGLQLGRRFNDSAAEMLGASTTIYLLSKPAGSQASPGIQQQRDYQRHWTPVHLDFIVDDVLTAVKKAKAAGAKLESDVQTHNWGHIAYLADPFGNGFCLIELIGRGYDEILG